MSSNWPHIEAGYAGLSRDADDPVTPEHLAWADMIMVMENRQKKRLVTQVGPPPAQVKLVALDIPDRFEFMDQDSIDTLILKLGHHFGPPEQS